MRFYISSMARAKTLAERLTDLSEKYGERRIAHTDAQRTLARILGYEDWTELKKSIEAGNNGSPTDLDETLAPEALQIRLRDQADILIVEFGYYREAAAQIVAHLRATAHPAGPHRAEGPCSILNHKGAALEFRGLHADGKPIVLIDGREKRLALTVVDADEGTAPSEFTAANSIGAVPKDFFLSVRTGRAPYVDVYKGLSVRLDRASAESALPSHMIVSSFTDWNQPSRQPSSAGTIPTRSVGPDLTVFEDRYWHTFVARIPRKDFGTTVVRVRIGTDAKFGLIDARAALMGWQSPADIARESGMPEVKDIDLLRCLEICGFVVPRSPLLQDLSDEDRYGDSRIMLDVDWSRIKRKGNPKSSTDKIDTGAIYALLNTTNTSLSTSLDVYNGVRDVPENANLRSCLFELPTLFDIVRNSPELLCGDMPLDDLKAKLLTGGASNSRSGTRRSLEPIPGYLLDWLIARRWPTPSKGPTILFETITALIVLGPEKMPRTESQWRDLIDITEVLQRIGPNAARCIGAEALANLMKDSERQRSGRDATPAKNVFRPLDLKPQRFAGAFDLDD
ncbi:hypothetical protein [Methylobacterium radiotolerans]|uniref:hypothetical protein n=1 Tax=Methylobacterium radiotolerans TaxID=31998 RepID=UPI0038D13733